MNRLFIVTITTGLLAASACGAQDRGDQTFAPAPPPPPLDSSTATPAQNVMPTATTLGSTQANGAAVDGHARVVPLANSDAEAKTAADDARRVAAAPVPALPPEAPRKLDSPGLPPEVQKAAEATELPVITVRQDGTDTIEEYRKNGKLFAQRIISNNSGQTKWYVDRAYNGPMPPDPAAGVSGHITPVEYRVFEWK